MKFTIMEAVYILIFGEMAGFKIVLYLAKHMKKALKYVISKYTIWKNVVYFHPVQIHGNNIKVYKNSVCSSYWSEWKMVEILLKRHRQK